MQWKICFSGSIQNSAHYVTKVRRPNIRLDSHYSVYLVLIHFICVLVSQTRHVHRHTVSYVHRLPFLLRFKCACKRFPWKNPTRDENSLSTYLFIWHFNSPLFHRINLNEWKNSVLNIKSHTYFIISLFLFLATI